MGQKFSLLKQNESYRNSRINPDEMQILATQEELIREITEMAINLSENYNKEFLRPDFCNRVSLVATEKLGNYSKSQLNDVVYTLGIVAEDPALKENLCQAIIDHYMNRIQLISTIINSIEPCINMVKAVNTGPICAGNPDVFDQDECEKTGGKWESFNFMTHNIDKSSEFNKVFVDSLDSLNTEFTRDLEAIKKILEDLMNINYNIQDEQLEKLKIETQQLLQKMESKCKLNYYNILLNPPKSWSEINNTEYNLKQREELTQRSLEAQGKIEEEVRRIEAGINDVTIPETTTSM